jgi:hypothetical protein
VKRLIIFLFFSINICLNVIAGPACSKPFQVIQPNGDTIWVALHGDEYASWYEDSKGNVIDRDSSGYWVYVTVSNEKIILTDQMVISTSTLIGIDKNIIFKVISNKRKIILQKKHYTYDEEELPQLQKQTHIEKWINSKINCNKIEYPFKELDWMINRIKCGKFDFSCVLLYKNDSTNDYYVVNHYIDFYFRDIDTRDIVNVVEIYKYDRTFVAWGSIQTVKFNIYNELFIMQDKKLQKCLNKFFVKKYKQLEKFNNIAQRKNKQYLYGLYMPCENCEEFFNTHTLVDIIGYSYTK